MCPKSSKQIVVMAWFLVVILGPLFTPHAACAAGIDGTNKWAWSTSAGWSNFKPANGGVSVYADHLEGYAWAENIGWIRLGAYIGGAAHTYTNTSNADYGVNRNTTTGELSGFGWATNAGWINFKPTHGGVTIDPATGDFSGYAWAENIGWIKLKGTAANAAAYKVALSVGTLAVTNGTGGGDYLPGTVVSIAANVSAAGQVFDKWTGDTASIANINLPNTTLVMPFAAATVIATYKAQGSTQYSLAVTNGTGSGSYLPGTVVNISANAPGAGQVFDKWTGNTANIANINLPDTTLYMPSAAATVTATYKAQGLAQYTLTVTSGTGSGSYLPGTVVNIAANGPAAGQVFDKWTGDTANIANINLPETTLYMPFAAATVTAAYKAQGSTQYTLTVTSGTGSGSYLPGTVVTISASAPGADQVFDKWVGQTPTVKNINSATTTVVMPFHEVAVKAAYITHITPEPSAADNLQVTINPFPMIWSLARWRVDGGNWISPGISGVSLTPGVHTVAFESVPGWITPQPLNVDILDGQTATITVAYLPEPAAPEPFTPDWLNNHPNVDLSSKIRQGTILVPTLPLIDLGSGRILSVQDLIKELMGIGDDQSSAASQPSFAVDCDASTGLVTIHGTGLAPYVIYAQLCALWSTTSADQIVFNGDGNLLLVRRNLAMQLSWAGGDCEGLLRALAGYQLFAVMDPNSGLIKVTTRWGADHYLLRFGVALSQGATAQPALVYDETGKALYLANSNGRQRLTPFAHHLADLRTWLSELGWSVIIEPLSGHLLVTGSDGTLVWRGLPDLLVRADPTAVDFSIEWAGDMNGDGLDDIRLRGGGYAQVIFSQPLN
jgi:hypothetical protein